MAKRKSKAMTPEQIRNAKIFRLRGFYSNAKTLPFAGAELEVILDCVDAALMRLKATPQSEYMRQK